MNFVSLDFIIFLIVVLIGFYSVKEKWRMPFILAASYFFYGYWSIPYLFLLIFTMGIDFYFAIQIEDAKRNKLRKFYLILSLSLNLGILFIFKYFNFTMELLRELVGIEFKQINLILPFAISFYTFHAMSYIIDVYRKEIKAERNFIPYSAYVMFFPQLVAGPIARAQHLLYQFREKKSLKVDQWLSAFWYIGCGYIMKMVLADNIGPTVDYYYDSGAEKTVFNVAQGTYLFAFQIYFDFAGYTSIAIGIAKLFDFELVKNFDRPYISQSVTEFWRRWHISLSTWLRDYLYISLGGNRGGQIRTYRNLMLTMILGGIWHGANLTFLLWGLLHGFYLVVEKSIKNVPLIINFFKCIPGFIRVIIVFNLISLAWIPFRSKSITDSLERMQIFSHWISNPFSAISAFEVQKKLWFLIIGWLIFESIIAKYDLHKKFIKSNVLVKYCSIYAIIFIVVLFAQTNPEAFIYFQF